MDQDIKIKIQNLPFWKSKIKIISIKGGLTNQNFLIENNSNKYVVRLGEDLPEHLISRSNELIAMKAAAQCGISPKVVYHTKGVLIQNYIESKTLTKKDVRKNVLKIIPIIKKIHQKIPKKIYGQSVLFWVFHVINNYAKFLKDNKSPHLKRLKYLTGVSKILEKKSAPHEIVFSHNDLLCGNFLDDGKRLWIIDWEYAGFNSPLFDLGGLASNNNFKLKEEINLLENYFGKKINEDLLLKYNSMKCASLLRETMWSMVSEITSNINFNYAEYSEKNYEKFFSTFKELELQYNL